MNNFKDQLKTVNGLQFVYENLHLRTQIGKSLLLNQFPYTDAELLQQELDKVENGSHFWEMNHIIARQIPPLLQELNDIQQTIQNLKKLQVLDDIELFEIKKFAILSQKIKALLEDADYQDIALDNLSKVVETLDPEKSQIPHFYIYSVYHQDLEPLRKKIQQTTDPSEKEKLIWQASQIEDSVRQKLTELLHPYWANLLKNLHALAYFDLLLGKAQLALTEHWCKPEILMNTIQYKQLFNPEVKSILQQTNQEFQSIDIELRSKPCLITGANMSGKTVLLKTIALSQTLFQFGFYVPAHEATLCPVEEIICLIEDQQSEKKGLSSFAIEILNIDKIIQYAKKGTKLLALVDELARTTNPDEGKCLVNAFITMMDKYDVMSVVTTHYSGITAPCHRLRVNGLIVDEISDKITPQNINRFMDYSLVETTSDDVPAEALKIAEIFNIDDEFLQLAKKK